MCFLPGQVSIVLVPVVDGIQDNRKCVDDCTNKNSSELIHTINCSFEEASICQLPNVLCDIFFYNRSSSSKKASNVFYRKSPEGKISLLMVLLE